MTIQGFCKALCFAQIFILNYCGFHMVISVQYICLICLDCLTKHVLHIVRLKPLFAGASFNWACFNLFLKSENWTKFFTKRGK